MNSHDNFNELHSPGYTPGAAATKRNPIGIVLGIIVVLLLAIAGVVTYMLVSATSSGSATGSAPITATSTVVVANSAQPPAQRAPEDTWDTATNPDVPAEPSAQPAPRTGTTAPVAPSIPAGAQEAGVTGSGWVDNPSVNCGANEDLVYAGRGDSAWVTVCESDGGRLTYRSDIFDGSLTAEVTAADLAVGRFTVDAAPSRIIVEGDVVRVYQDNNLVAEEPLPSSWLIS